MIHSIDAQQLVRFAELIGRPSHEVRVRAFKPSGSARNELTPRKGLLSQLDEIQKWNAEGRGIYAVINAGGDDDASITSCVCLFAEWDDRPIDWQINAWQELELPPPTLQVLTGGKSAHSHWRIVPTSVEEWKPLQQRLIHHAGCDTTIKNPSRVMRAPGCWYVNGNDEHVAQAELINATGNIYSAELFDQLLPQLPEAKTRRPIRFNPFGNRSRTGCDPDQGSWKWHLRALPEHFVGAQSCGNRCRLFGAGSHRVDGGP